MSVAIELWFENLRKNKLFERKEPRTHRLDEVSIKGSQQTFDYMAANGESIQTEFDELFAGGALRKIIPMESRAGLQTFRLRWLNKRGSGLPPPVVENIFSSVKLRLWI